MIALPGMGDDLVAALVSDVRTAVRSRLVLEAGQPAALAILSNLYLDRPFADPNPAHEFRRRVEDYLGVGLAASLSPGPLFDIGYLRSQSRLGASDHVIAHWLRNDAARRATSPIFDAQYYLRTHRDVAVLGTPAALHFANQGVYQNRTPSRLWSDITRHRQLDLVTLCRGRFDRSTVGALGYDFRRFFPRDIGAIGELGFLTETLSHPALPIDLPDITYMLALFDFAPTGEGDRAWIEDWLVFIRSGTRDRDIGGFCDFRSLEELLGWIRQGRPERRLPTTGFSEADYFAVNPDLKGSPQWSFEHYIVEGRFQGRRPSSVVDPFWYRAVYDVPERADPFAHWARMQKRGESRLALVPVYEEGEGEAVAELAVEGRADWLRRHGVAHIPESLRHGALAAAVERAAALDPLVQAGSTRREIVVPNIRYAAVAVSKRIRAGAREALKGRDPDLVILAPSGEAAAGAAARNLAEAAGRLDLLPLVVFTDDENGKRPNLPFSFDFAAATRALAPEERPRLLCDMVFGLGTKTVLNVGSSAGWSALRDYGRALARYFNLACFVFRGDQERSAPLQGYGQFFPEVFPFVRAFVFDSQSSREQMAATYGINPDTAKLVALADMNADGAECDEAYVARFQHLLEAMNA